MTRMTSSAKGRSPGRFYALVFFVLSSPLSTRPLLAYAIIMANTRATNDKIISRSRPRIKIRSTTQADLPLIAEISAPRGTPAAASA